MNTLFMAHSSQIPFPADSMHNPSCAWGGTHNTSTPFDAYVFWFPRFRSGVQIVLSPIVFMVKSYIWCTDRLLWRVPVDAWQGGVQAQDR